MRRYDIERHPRWDREDARSPERKFFVYVLSTKYGHYVGHTGNLTKRMDDHRQGKVQSTYGSRPRLIWNSRPFPSRDVAAEFERALKFLRDRRDPEYRALIGRNPVPWRGAWRTNSC